MNGVKDIALLLKFGLILFVFTMLGCSGDDGTSGTGEKPKVYISGTAAAGKAISASEVTLKSKKGTKKTQQTDADGKFSIDVTDLESPYLIRVKDSANHYYYSVATVSPTENNPNEIANIHPVSDLIIRNWYKVKGSDVEMEFDNDQALANPPTESEIDLIKQALAAILSELFASFNLPDNFDLIKTAFDADGQNFDRLLDYIKVHIHDDKVTIRIREPETDIEADLTDDLDLHTDLTQTDEIDPVMIDGARIFAFAYSETEMIVVWTPATDNIAVSGYEIYRDGNLIATSPFPVYWDKGLSSNTEYCYSVRAFDEAHRFSQPLETSQPCPTTLVDTAPPSIPTNVTGNLIAPTLQSDYSLQLNWTLVPEDIIAYEIYRNINDGEYALTPYTTVIVPPFTDIGLTPGSKYCYKVKSIDSTFLRSAASDPFCVTVPTDTSTMTPEVDPIPGTTTNTEIVMTGKAEAFSTVTVQGGASEVSTSTSGSGYFSVVVPLTANATNDLQVFATDQFNNQSSITTVDINGSALSIVQDSSLPAVVNPVLSETLINGNIDSAGKVDIHTISGSAGDIVNFTLVVNSGFTGTAANFTLYSPTGVLVNNRGYNSNTELRFTLTETGDYKVHIIAANSTATGTYTLRYHKIFPAAGANLQAGVLTPATISAAGEQHFFYFNGNAGETVNFTFVHTAGFTGTAANFALLSPTGVLVNNRGYNSNSELRFILGETGLYAVRILAANYLATGDYMLGIEQFSAPATANGTLQPGQLFSADITQAGQQDFYTFDASSGDIVNFTFVHTVGFTGTAANFALFSPSGTLINNRSYNSNSELRFILQETGTFVVRILASNYLATGVYRLGYEKFKPATLANAQLNPGDLLTATISSAAQQDLYTFDATAGDIVDFSFVHVVGFTGTAANFALISPSGALINNRSYNSNSELRFILQETGTFVVRILASNYLATGDYKLGFEKLNSATTANGALTPGDLFSATISEAGQIDFYTFDANANDIVDFSFLHTIGFTGTAANFQLYSPSGVLVNNRGYNSNSELRFILQETGTFVVRILASNYLATGDYKLGFEKESPAVSSNGALTPGNLFTASITEAGQIDLYTFDATAGNIVDFSFIHTLGFTGTAANFALYAPSGAFINNRSYNSNSELRFILQETGTFVIRIMASNYLATGDYKLGFEIQNPASTANGSLTPGDLFTASITEAGQIDLYTFDATAGEIVDFSIIHTLGFTGAAANFQLYSPSGALINNRGYNSNSELRFILQETGTYVVRIIASNYLATGDYKLGYEKQQPADSSNGVLTPGILQTGTLSESGQIDLYTLDVTAGDVVDFSIVHTSGFVGAAVNFALYAPSGAWVNNRGYNSNSELRFNLSETGTYVVRIIASNYLATGSYSLGYEKFLPAVAANGTLTIGGAAASGSITAAGQIDFYSFSGSAGGSATVSLAQISGFTGTAANFYVISPTGTLLNNRGYNANAAITFTLPDNGDYVIRVMSANYLGTGDYSLSVN